VIDIALKYGYESSDAFCVAFKRLYGITPSQARKTRRKLKRYDPVLFTLSISYVKGEPTMIEIQNVHREQMPPLKLIGKRYTNADRVDGSYGAHWQEWFDKKWFAPLEALPMLPPDVETGCIGFMRWNCADFDTSFEYWIGTMDLLDTSVPEGYESIELPAKDVGVCWLYGKEKDGIYGQHDRCVEAIEAKWELYTDPQGYMYCFERYNGERFKDQDGKNRVILDYGIYLK